MSEQSNEAVVLTGSQIQVAGVLQIAYALALEINTGLRASRSWLRISQDLVYEDETGLHHVTTKRTKKGALEDTVSFLRKVMPAGWEPGPGIKRALGEKP